MIFLQRLRQFLRGVFASSEIDYSRFSRGIAWVESRNGKYLRNPTSSASGKYQQLFTPSLQKAVPELKNVGRTEFIDKPELQELVFNRRFYDGFRFPDGRMHTTALLKDAKDLYNDYYERFYKFPYSHADLAALSYFLGRTGARRYLNGLISGDFYSAPGINLHPEIYLKKFREKY